VVKLEASGSRAPGGKLLSGSNAQQVYPISDSMGERYIYLLGGPGGALGGKNLFIAIKASFVCTG
jgi:hypothetical protein